MLLCRYNNGSNVPLDHSQFFTEACTLRKLTKTEFSGVLKDFTDHWNPLRYPCPRVEHIFGVKNRGLEFQWNEFRKNLPGHLQEVKRLYHGTSLTCDITFSSPCSGNDCGICGISKNGMSPDRIKLEALHRCGHAFYFSPTPAKSHEYTKGIEGRRAMLSVDVIPGRQGEDPNRLGECFDSVREKSRNFEILALRESKRVIPRYIIVYKL